MEAAAWGGSEGPRTVGVDLEASGSRVLEARYPGGAEYDTHEHDEAYLCLVLHGGFDEWLGDAGRQTLRSGEHRVYRRGSRHAVRTGAVGVRLLHVTDPEGRDWAGAAPEITGMLWQIASALRHADAGRGADAERLHLDSLVFELRAPAVSEATTDRDWLDRARDVLRQASRRPIGLPALAAEVGKHPAHLARAFRNRFGLTAGEYLRRVRVADAVHRLRETDEPLSSVALSAGFADQSHMGRWIRAYLGVTPGAVRTGRTGYGPEGGELR